MSRVANNPIPLPSGVEVKLNGQGKFQPTTVEGMFDLIGDTLARPADQFSFAYSEDGSPSSLRFDYEWRTADDEFSYLDVNVFTN